MAEMTKTSDSRAVVAPSAPLATIATEDFAGPAWNNSTEYPSISSNEFVHDLAQLDQLIKQIASMGPSLKALIAKADADPAGDHDHLISELQAHSELENQANTLLSSLFTFVRCEKDIDGTNADAIRMNGLLAEKRAHFMTAITPARLYLDRAPETLVTRYLLHEHTASEEFSLRQSRALNDTALSEEEQTLLEQLRTHGFDSWSNLYSQLASSLRLSVAGVNGGPAEEMGLAQAAGLIRHPSEPQRKAAWTAIQTAWRANEIPCAAILNGLAGWRLTTYRRRSHTRRVDYLDFPIHQARIKEETLEAMMSAVSEARPLGQRAMRAIARGLGKRQLDPWDLLAPAPVHMTGSPARTFKEGLGIIRDAFAKVDPNLADFVNTMEKNRWIEGRVLPSKQQGAYCTRFAKSHTPRVFQTYMGSISDIRTLAHELGHAYHAWVMRDLPSVLHRYPMTLAETASIFAETAFAEHLGKSGDKRSELEIAWQDAESAAGFLLNIPARFDFERSFYDRRQTAAVVGPQELGELTDTAWRHWYGDTLSETDRQYWMTKLHFSMSSVSFYNYPYTFGYLFSLSIFAMKDLLRAGFMPMYMGLLRDTGRMTAEALAQRHLNEDITKPEFWKRSLVVVEKQVARFEALLPKGH